MKENKEKVVSENTIKATKCDKSFACLQGEKTYCGVVSTLGHAMLSLVCRDKLDCRHNKAYGALRICKCPVRHEIFTKYGE